MLRNLELQTLSLGSGMRILPFSSRRMAAYAKKNLSANHVASMPFAHGAISRSRNVLARRFAHQPQHPQQGELLRRHREPRRFAMNDASTATATVAKRATISGASVENGQVEITWGDASKDIFSAVWLRGESPLSLPFYSLSSLSSLSYHISCCCLVRRRTNRDRGRERKNEIESEETEEEREREGERWREGRGGERERGREREREREGGSMH
jgi:hypothetical protein